ncbi:MAG: hypothetical protein RLZZ165_1775 [Bacteroidota bacterium]|jgi:hypothetical protein
MNLDPESALQLAFQHLDSFSVEGVGTFQRSRMMAQIDHQKKRILPPREIFVLTEGEDMLHRLEDFLFRWYNLRIGDATALAGKVSDFLLDRLNLNPAHRIDGIGTLRRSPLGDIEFQAEEGIIGQAAGMFGLQAIDYTLGETSVPSPEKKEAAVARATADTTIVEAPRPIRKFPMRWAMLLMLLTAGAFSAWKWQVELRNLPVQWGWTQKPSSNDPNLAQAEATPEMAIAESLAHGSSSEASTAQQELQEAGPIALAKAAEKPGGTDSASIASPEMPPADPKSGTTSAPARPMNVHVPESGLAPKTNPDNPLANDLEYGVRPQNGHYYLIVSSNAVPEEAVGNSNSIPGSKVLVPHSPKGYFKVSVFESTSKEQVIARMVSLKSTYPKSWIFWPGMPIAGNN